MKESDFKMNKIIFFTLIISSLIVIYALKKEQNSLKFSQMIMGIGASSLMLVLNFIGLILG